MKDNSGKIKRDNTKNLLKDSNGKVLLALLAGASAGVVAGLLMAPDSGEATRGSVKSWASKLSKDLEANLQAGLDEIKNMSSDAYSKVSGAAGNVVDEAKDLASNAKDKVNQVTGNTSGGSSAGGNASGGGSNAGGSTGSSSGGGSTAGGSTGSNSGGGSTAGGGASGGGNSSAGGNNPRV